MDLQYRAEPSRRAPTTRSSRCSTKVRWGQSLQNGILRKPFRTLAGFGKRTKYWIIGRMLREGLDIFLPLVDDGAVDILIRRSDGSVALVQIGARSEHVVLSAAAPRSTCFRRPSVKPGTKTSSFPVKWPELRRNLPPSEVPVASICQAPTSWLIHTHD